MSDTFTVTARNADRFVSEKDFVNYLFSSLALIGVYAASFFGVVEILEKSWHPEF